MPESLDKSKGQHKPGASDKLKDRLGSARKVAARKLPGWVYKFAQEKWQLRALLIGTSIIAAFMMAPKSYNVATLVVGEPSQETIISPITFKVIDEAATNKNRDEVLRSAPPVYDFDEEMIHDVQARISSAFSFMKEYQAAEEENRLREEEKARDPKPPADSKTTNVKPFQMLEENAQKGRFESLLGTSVSQPCFIALRLSGFNAKAERDLRSLVVPMLLRGVVLSRELLMRDAKHGILVKTKSKDKLEPLKDLSTIYDLKEAVDLINQEEIDPSDDSVLSQAIRKIATDLINVNLTYNREKTSALRQEALASVKPVFFQVSKGEQIVKEGEPVNESHLRKLDGLRNAHPAYSTYVIIAGFSLLLILLTRVSFYFSQTYLGRSKDAIKDALFFCILIIGAIVLVKFSASLSIVFASATSSVNARSILFASPLATAPMLASLMVDPKIAFIIAALTSIIATISVEGDIYLFCFFFIAGIVGVHGVSKVTERTHVLRAGLVVGLVNMLSILGIKMALGNMNTVQDAHEIGLGFLGGVLSGLLVSGLAPLLEPLGYTTNIKLLEIANLNHPLLKRMALEAPGTYHHSMVVGNLAEAAAEAIGANPLLARVGALYHDIGKISKTTKPTYFIENQVRGINPHDRLEPSMSALILVSHVKNGVEKAKEYRLSAPIVEIIQEHHGTSLIKFFHNKAVERSEKTHQVVSEDKYRYPGPMPQTKESALVMLSDVTEAATRTLSDPSPGNIQKRVHSLVMGLFHDGQLDQSTLTLKDINAVIRSLARALQGILHSRIDYPADNPVQERSNGNPNRQPAELPAIGYDKIADENGTDIKRIGL